MPDHDRSGAAELNFLAQLAEPTGRRKFLKFAGFTIAVSAIACRADGVTQPARATGDSHDAAVSLGTGDVAVLNYAYALEQLEAAFYTQVVAAPYAGITPEELAILTDIKRHEVIHREFLKQALGAAAIPGLAVDFTSVDFTQRTTGAGNGVLDLAKVFEDIGVSAYNGAGKLLANVDFLVVAGKIVSVEARHAAAIRDLLNPKSRDFAGDDVVDEQGLDIVREPAEVLPLADPFVVNAIDASGLPTA
jgi:hypothetical protein